LYIRLRKRGKCFGLHYCYSHTWSSCHLILLCIHDIDPMHVHAIGVPEGVTLMEFEGTSQEVEEPALAQEA
jgi:hypothetical protein